MTNTESINDYLIGQAKLACDFYDELDITEKSDLLDLISSKGSRNHQAVENFVLKLCQKHGKTEELLKKSKNRLDFTQAD